MKYRDFRIKGIQVREVWLHHSFILLILTLTYHFSSSYADSVYQGHTATQLNPFSPFLIISYISLNRIQQNWEFYSVSRWCEYWVTQDISVLSKFSSSRVFVKYLKCQTRNFFQTVPTTVLFLFYCSVLPHTIKSQWLPSVLLSLYLQAWQKVDELTLISLHSISYIKRSWCEIFVKRLANGGVCSVRTKCFHCCEWS